MIRPYYEEIRRASSWTPPPPPTSSAWDRTRSDPACPAGGHSDVGARGREIAPCPGQKKKKLGKIQFKAGLSKIKFQK